MKKYLTVSVLFVLIKIVVFGQSLPFPQNVTYPYGYKPGAISATLAQSEYNRWKQNFIVNCNNYKRTTTEVSGDTKVESMGWGLILAAYQGDKITFDGLWNFYNSKRTAKAHQMMGWWVTCSGFHDEGSATDGDLDAAFALIIAHKQWGGVYLDSAISLLDIIRTDLISQCTVNGQSVYVLKGGYADQAWGGCELTDISYYTPAFFRVFAQVTGDAVWSQLADDTYIILNAGANPTTGLVPDWQSADGVPGPLGRNGTYAYDASRVPWRIALDYLWNGNALAKTWCTKVTNWANGIGPANIMDGYNLDGTTTKTYNNSAFVGGFAVGAMCNSQAVADNFATRMAQLNDTYWFNLNTRVVYLHVMTGNFWQPQDITSVIAVPEFKRIKVYFDSLNSNLNISGTSGVKSLEVIDMSGRVIKSSPDIYNDNIILNLPSLKKGIYILKASSANGQYFNVKFTN